jgi:hypothetical protein
MVPIQPVYWVTKTKCQAGTAAKRRQRVGVCPAASRTAAPTTPALVPRPTSVWAGAAVALSTLHGARQSSWTSEADGCRCVRGGWCELLGWSPPVRVTGWPFSCWIWFLSVGLWVLRSRRVECRNGIGCTEWLAAPSTSHGAPQRWWTSAAGVCRWVRVVHHCMAAWLCITYVYTESGSSP